MAGSRAHRVCWSPTPPDGARLRLVVVSFGAPSEPIASRLANEALGAGARVAGARVEVSVLTLPAGCTETDVAALDAALREGDSSHIGWLCPALVPVGGGGFELLLAHASRPDVTAAAPRVLDARGVQTWPPEGRGSATVVALPTHCAALSREAYVAAGGLAPDLSFGAAVQRLSASLRPPMLVATDQVTLFETDAPLMKALDAHA